MRHLLAACLLLFATGSALACDCGGQDLCFTLGKPDRPAFTGAVESIGEAQTADGRQTKVHIRVTGVFGGLASDTREVDVFTSGSCAYPFKLGEAYLIDANYRADGILFAGLCGATRPLSEAAAALYGLRRQLAGQPMPAVMGQIARYERDFKGTTSTLPAQGLADALVRMTSDGKSYETRADSQGVYAFYDLPPSDYAFAADVPEHSELALFIGSDKAPAGIYTGSSIGCRERNLGVYPTGSIEGRLLDASGKPLSDAAVYIVPADWSELPRAAQLYRETQDKRDILSLLRAKTGAFKFLHLQPGRYRVLVNPDNAQDPAFPYERTFYPGVRNQAEAAAITLEAGAHIREIELRLTPSFTARRITTRVLWPDGRMVTEDLNLYVKGVANPDARYAANRIVSPVELLLHPKEAYQLQVYANCRYRDEKSGLGGGLTSLPTQTVTVTPDDALTELTLTVNTPACPVRAGMKLIEN